MDIMKSFFNGSTLKVVEKGHSGTVKELATNFLLYGTLAEIFARENGFNKGLGGSMHAFFTPFGVFPLKYFFSNPIPTQGSKEYSATSIREMIKDIIQSEGSKKHLSDQKITDLLEKRGIKIARRTVAKYRKGLKILPSNLRR